MNVTASLLMGIYVLLEVFVSAVDQMLNVVLKVILQGAWGLDLLTLHLNPPCLHCHKDGENITEEPQIVHVLDS